MRVVEKRAMSATHKSFRHRSNNLRGQDMYKIGDFSKMSKTTIKALRYYEKEGLLKPVFIDQNTSYRYYESSQLVDISKIVSLR